MNEVHSFIQRRLKMKTLLVVAHPRKDSLTWSLTNEIIRGIEKKVATMKY